MSAPLYKIKVGNVSVTIWENQGRDNQGRDFTTQSFQVQKDYQQKNGDWKSTNSFKASELQYVILACEEALRWKYLKNDKPVDDVPV